MSEPMVTIQLPMASWKQIVSDIENMCGTQAENIEILQDAEIIGCPLSGLDNRCAQFGERS